MKNKLAHELLQEMIDTDFERIEEIRHEMRLLAQATVIPSESLQGPELAPGVCLFYDSSGLSDLRGLSFPSLEMAVQYMKAAGWAKMETMDGEGYKITYEKN